MDDQTYGRPTGLLTDRAAGGLLCAFLASVILVLAVATSIPTVVPDASSDELGAVTSVSTR